MAQQPVIPQVQPTRLPAIVSWKRGGATPQVMCPVMHGGVMKSEMYDTNSTNAMQEDIFFLGENARLKMTMAFETSQIMVKKTYQPQLVI